VKPSLDSNLIYLAIVAGTVVGLVYEVFLGHRHDYTGHYAAGFGATYCVLMLVLRHVDHGRYASQSALCLVPVCIVCIGLGAIAEATAFRIARFDEIDFFNQSLGAVLATACASSHAGRSRPADVQFDYGCMVGVAFLGIGGCFAVA